MAGVDQHTGRSLGQSIEAQEILRTLAGSTAPIQSHVHIGQLMSQEDAIGLTGRALAANGMWGAVTVPADEPRRGSFRGIVDQPQVALRLLDLFPSVPFDGRLASFMTRQGGVAQAASQTEGAIKQAADITPRTSKPIRWRAGSRLGGRILTMSTAWGPTFSRPSATASWPRSRACS
jgi:hypothetical protein